MPNRFVRRIKSGEIESVDELKSEFKALAKLSHPDLAGAGSKDDFARLREEYEAALRDFRKHRFGARAEAGATGAEADSASHSAPSAVGDEAWGCLAIMLKRGFPKDPRHEKERLRYDYARWRLEEALGAEAAARFRACESELLAGRGRGDPLLAAELALLGDLIEFRELGLSPMRTGIVLALGSLRTGAGPAYLAFARALAADLGIGIEIGG